MEWNYVRNKSIPKDGTKKTIAIYSQIEGVSRVEEIECNTSHIVVGKDCVVYAWSDGLTEPPPVKMPYAWMED